MANYRLSPTAKEDLERIWFYGLEIWGERAADRYIEAFFDQFEKIAAEPLLHQAVDEIRDGYRRCVCGRDNIYYRLDGEDVEIMAVLGQQDLDKWL